MIFQFGQQMADKERERGRLFSIQMDGSDSVPFIIKKDKLLIGRGDSCEIRIYVDGVAHEHCIITFNEDGRGFVESVNKCGLTFLNGELIERQVSLEHNDVITVVKRSFRFYYPTSSKFFVANEPAAFEDNMVKVLPDFEVEDAFSKKAKDISEKHVTFGPRLSPEEFDKRMPPASPLRKGSLPRDKLKNKIPSYEQDVTKSQIKKNLFMNSPASRGLKSYEKSASEMPESSVVLKRLSCSGASMKDSRQEENSNLSRPLFSEIVKKSAADQSKNTVQSVQKYSPQKFIKKTKLKDSRKIFYKSPRRPVHPRLLAVGSTGHANSPETIVICKKRFSPISSVKRRKSLRLLQEKVVTETSSERHGSKSPVDVNETNSLMSQNSASDSFSRMSSKNKTPIHTPIAEARKSSAVKRKVNDENKDGTPVKNRDEDTPLRKRNENNIHSEGNVENYASSKKRFDTLDGNNIVSPARKSLSTPARGSLSTPVMRNQDEMPDELIEDEPEGDFPAEEVGESEAPSTSSSLVAAINNVAQIDENNLDKSLKDIHNIVQALSCHSNVPTLGSDRLTADMCTNAVKKLALTISMINAFHMYNRIIDDVSSFPLCFPSTSFEPNRDSMRRLPRSAGRQNEDFARMSWFQDIVHNSFSNSASSEPRRMLRTCENGLSPDTESSLSNKKSRRSKLMSGNKIHLRAIDSGHKISTRQSSDSHITFESEGGDVNESNHSDKSSSDNECYSAVNASSHSKSPRPITHKGKVSSTTSSKISVSLDKDNSFDSPSLHAVSHDELSFSSNLQKTNGARMSSASAGRKSTSKHVESIPDSPNVSFEKKKSPIFTKSKNVKISSEDMPKNVESVVTAYSKMLRSRTSTLLKPKQRSVSFVAKKFVMTASKKLKVQKKEQKHRIDVLKKVKYRVASPKIKIIKSNLKSPRSVRASLKGINTQSDHSNLVRLSQKIAKKAKSKKRLSPALRLSGKLGTSPKGLKKYVKRKSVFKSNVIKRKSLRSAKLSSEKRKSAVDASSSEVTCKRSKRSRSVNVKSGINKNDYDEIAVKSKTKHQRKGMLFNENLNSAVEKRPDVNKENDAAVDIKRKSTKEKVAVNAKTKNLRKRKVKSENLNLVAMEKCFDDLNNENNVPVDMKSQSTKNDSEKIAARTVTKNERKRKVKSDDNLDLVETENISENEQGKCPKTAVKSKKGGRSKTKIPKTRAPNTPAVNNEDNKSRYLLEEIADNNQTDKKIRTTKRNQKSETNVNSTTLKRNTRSTNRQDTHVSQMTLNEENVEIKVNKKTAKQRKAAETKKTKLEKLIASPPKKITRNTRKKNLQIGDNVESKETSLIAEDTKKVNQKKERKRKAASNVCKTSAKIPFLEENCKVSEEKIMTENFMNKMPTSTPKKDTKKVDQKKERKRKADDNVSKASAKIPLLEENKVSEEKITTEKDTKNMPTSTPKKGRSKVVSKRRKVNKEVSPVQRVQRSLRSRK